MNEPTIIAAGDYANEDRICPSCGEKKPPSAFKSPKTARCKHCMNRATGRTVQIRILKQAITRIANRQIIAAARGDRIDAPRISQVCAKMVELFGGVDKFCVQWQAQIMEVIENKPGSQLALSQLQSIAKLIKDSTSSMDAASEVTSLTDGELDVAVSNAVDGAVARIVNEQSLLESDNIDAENIENVDPDFPDDEVGDDLDD